MKLKITAWHYDIDPDTEQKFIVNGPGDAGEHQTEIDTAVKPDMSDYIQHHLALAIDGMLASRNPQAYGNDNAVIVTRDGGQAADAELQFEGANWLHWVTDWATQRGNLAMSILWCDGDKPFAGIIECAADLDDDYVMRELEKWIALDGELIRGMTLDTI